MRTYFIKTAKNTRFIDGFCFLNHFHKQIEIHHSRSGINQKIVITGLKHLALALFVNTDLPAHLGSGPQMRASKMIVPTKKIAKTQFTMAGYRG